MARHLQQTEARDTADLNSGAIYYQCIAHFIFHGFLVLAIKHIDKVDNNQAAHVTQTQLAGDFFRRLFVSVKCSLFNIAAFGGAGTVDID